MPSCLSSSADEHRVTNLPGLDDTSLQQWAGLLPVDDPATGKLFYWLFKADEDPDNNKPLIIWMNGGPVSPQSRGGMVAVGASAGQSLTAEVTW